MTAQPFPPCLAPCPNDGNPNYVEDRCAWELAHAPTRAEQEMHLGRWLLSGRLTIDQYQELHLLCLKPKDT